MAKHSLELKTKIVTEYLEGKSSLKTISQKYNVDDSQISVWVNNYRNFGLNGLKRSRKNKSYSVEFKLEVLTHYESSEMSYREVANKFGINNPSMIANWRKSYEIDGIDGLSNNQGRPKKVNTSNKKPKIKDEKTNSSSISLEDAKKKIQELEHENRMLTIKNEYLELLRSLRLEEKMKENQESSTNSEKDTH